MEVAMKLNNGGGLKQYYGNSNSVASGIQSCACKKDIFDFKTSHHSQTRLNNFDVNYGGKMRVLLLQPNIKH